MWALLLLAGFGLAVHALLGSCSDDGHIPAFAAVGAVAVYLHGLDGRVPGLTVAA